jgi:hypothetical protein
MPSEKKRIRRAEANRQRRYVRRSVSGLKALMTQDGRVVGRVDVILRVQLQRDRLVKGRLWGRVVDGLAGGERRIVRAMARFNRETAQMLVVSPDVPAPEVP